MSLHEKLGFFKSHLEHCTLCPRQCGADRLSGEMGLCKADSRLRVASYCLHRGEEPPISGTAGSGTVFFSNCTMNCVYCQNYPISQLGHGNTIEIADLAAMMLDLQEKGAHNINLVTPTHYLPHIVEAICTAREHGLTLPIVSNTSGYERPEIIRMLEGLVQIYLVDMRYSRSRTSARYSDAADYPQYNREAVKEMLARVGPMDYSEGPAEAGVLIRHLVLPSMLEETQEILQFIAGRLPPSVPVSLMTQYFPANHAVRHPEINRKITRREYEVALGFLEEAGIDRGWVQDPQTPNEPVT